MKKCGFSKAKNESVIKELLKYNLLTSSVTQMLSLPPIENNINESETQ